MSKMEELLKAHGIWDRFVSDYSARLPSDDVALLNEFLDNGGYAERTKIAYKSTVNIFQKEAGFIDIQCSKDKCHRAEFGRCLSCKDLHEVVRLKPLGLATYKDFDKFVNKLKQDDSVGVKRKKLLVAGVKQFLEFLRREYEAPVGESRKGKIRFNELKVVKSNREEVLTPQECREILDKARRANYIHYTILFVLIDSGMRIGELVNIQVQNVDLEKRTIKTVGKTGAKKFFVSEKCSKALATYLKMRQQWEIDHDYLFVSPQRKLPINKTVPRLRRLFKNYFPEGKWVTAHTLRRTCISNRFFEKKQDKTTISFLVGHESKDITEQYMHATDDQMRKLYDEGYFLE